MHNPDLEAAQEEIEQLQQRVEELEDDLTDLRDEKEELDADVKDLKETVQEQKEEIKGFKSQITQFKSDIKDKDQKYKDLVKEQRDLTNKYNLAQLNISQQMSKLESKEKEIESQDKANQMSRLNNQAMVEKMEELSNELVEAQVEIDTLLNRYLPKVNDEIDEALASFINTFPEKNRMKIMFLRESEGVYLFGHRQVHIKVEKGNKVMVRVGGGYVNVQEFIEQYQDKEIEKINRIDAFTRFRNKTELQSIALHKSSRSVERKPISTRLFRTNSISNNSLGKSQNPDGSESPLLKFGKKFSTQSTLPGGGSSSPTKESSSPRKLEVTKSKTVKTLGEAAASSARSPSVKMQTRGRQAKFKTNRGNANTARGNVQ